MSEPFLGQITMFGGNFAPRGWAFCNGQLLAINQNQALFSLLGTTYGGDGRTTFGLPDLRGRVPINSGGNSTGPGLSTYRLGQRGGVETNTLRVDQLPAHNHSVISRYGESTLQGTLKVGGGKETSTPEGGYPADLSASFGGQDIAVAGYSQTVSDPVKTMAADCVQVSLTGLTTTNTGANQAVYNLQPYLAINFIIAMQGIFPSRN